MFHTLHHVRLAGLRTAVPSQEIRLEDEVAFYGGSAKKVARLKTTLGMDRRRICPPDVTASDLCAHAAFALLEAFPDSRNTIDALVFVSQWPDWRQPATACELQHRLNLSVNCAAFDINQGCAGYVYGLWVAASLVSARAARQVLLLAGDTPTMDIDIRNRITAPIFGDAGSATLLEYDTNAPSMYFGLGTDGRGFETITIVGGGARIPFCRDVELYKQLTEDIVDSNGNIWHLTDTYMNGGEVVNFALNVVPDYIKSLLAYANKEYADIDNLFLHQANKYIVNNIARKSGFDINKTPSISFSKYGNSACASIPIAITDCYADCNKTSRFIMCGYGIGLSWALCLCDVINMDCKSPICFIEDPNRVTKQQRINRWKNIIKGMEAPNE